VGRRYLERTDSVRVESGTQSTSFNLFDLLVVGRTGSNEETEFEKTSDEDVVPIERERGELK
jgi:hypothetical protein